MCTCGWQWGGGWQRCQEPNRWGWLQPRPIWFRLHLPRSVVPQWSCRYPGQRKTFRFSTRSKEPVGDRWWRPRTQWWECQRRWFWGWQGLQVWKRLHQLLDRCCRRNGLFFLMIHWFHYDPACRPTSPPTIGFPLMGFVPTPLPSLPPSQPNPRSRDWSWPSCSDPSGSHVESQPSSRHRLGLGSWSCNEKYFRDKKKQINPNFGAYPGFGTSGFAMMASSSRV